MRVDLRNNLAATAVSVNDLCVVRGQRPVLRKVSLGFARGAVTAIVGPSGAGKTTLMSVLNGLIAPNSGIVSATSLGVLTDPMRWATMRRTTATIFQNHALIGRLSAMDNVLLGLADRRHPLSLLPSSRAACLSAARALFDVGLLDRALERVETLSGGEQQRVGLARALARRPSLLLGDEPFSSLDLVLARRLGLDLRTLATRDGVTVILILHQIALARVLADRIVGIQGGRVVFDGAATDFDAEAEARIFAAAVPDHSPSLLKGY
jgi:phosphonate transport system ATP-binding protein